MYKIKLVMINSDLSLKYFNIHNKKSYIVSKLGTYLLKVG